MLARADRDWSTTTAGAAVVMARRRWLTSGCVTDGRAAGAAGSFENEGNVKSKRCSGSSPPNRTFAVISAGSADGSIRASRYGRLRTGFSGNALSSVVLRVAGSKISFVTTRAVMSLIFAADERTAVVVVDVQPEDPGRRMHAFQVMPVVRRHEELAAVLRIVIAVRARRPMADARRSVGTDAGLEMRRRAIRRTRPRERYRDRHQLTPAQAALARVGLGDRRVHRTHPRRFEPHRHERQLAVGTHARLRLEDVGMVDARHRNRRQRRRGGRLGALGRHCRRDEQGRNQRREDGFHSRSRSWANYAKARREVTVNTRGRHRGSEAPSF